uniref:TSEN15 tRNA splicing endonuclease subunit n=1 Tax=Lates calcarifer TaxID=8187 RepID=A0A4W6FJF3_LATCA
TCEDGDEHCGFQQGGLSPGWLKEKMISQQLLCYREMKNLEVGDSAQVHAAFLVYMDLAEVRRWKEVSCVKSPELQVVLLEGREEEGAPIQTVLPLPVHQSLSYDTYWTEAFPCCCVPWHLTPLWSTRG